MRKAVRAVSVALLLACVGFVAPAQAERIPTRPEMRQIIQQDYIFQAVWDGRISWEDGKSLLVEQDALAEWLGRFQGNEPLSPVEVRTLDYMFDISSRNIDRALKRARSAEAPAPPATVQLATR